jgi:hypothetical protein
MAKSKAEPAGEKVNKSKVVYDAIEALGGDPGPKAIVEYVKQQHGLDFDYALVASYKSNYKAKKGGTGGGRRGGAGQISLTDLTTLKQLVDRVGENRIQEMLQTLKELRK